MGFWLIVAEVALFWLMAKYRRKDGHPSQYVTGEEKHLRRKWVTIPHFLVILCDLVIIVPAILVWVNVKQNLPPAEQTVRIFSQQWAWSFQQPGPDGILDTADDIRTVGELHVKANTVYHFELQSRDVLHSFSVPMFRLKQDAVPGRTITGWFKATVPGTYDIQCTQMCGMGHGLMGGQRHRRNTATGAPLHWIKRACPSPKLPLCRGRTASSGARHAVQDSPGSLRRGERQ